jgi:hypothetical protein
VSGDSMSSSCTCALFAAVRNDMCAVRSQNVCAGAFTKCVRLCVHKNQLAAISSQMGKCKFHGGDTLNFSTDVIKCIANCGSVPETIVVTCSKVHLAEGVPPKLLI